MFPEPCLQTRLVIQCFSYTGVKIPANVSSRGVFRSLNTGPSGLVPPGLNISQAAVKSVEHSSFRRLNQNVSAGTGGTSTQHDLHDQLGGAACSILQAAHMTLLLLVATSGKQVDAGQTSKG